MAGTGYDDGTIFIRFGRNVIEGGFGSWKQLNP
jgi:hypothetical protein